MVRLIHKFNTFSNYTSRKKKINLLSNNIRTLESNEKQKTKNIGTKTVCYFLKEQVILMEKIA